MGEIDRIYEVIADLQIQIRTCKPEKLGLIVLQLIDANLDLTKYLLKKAYEEVR